MPVFGNLIHGDRVNDHLHGPANPGLTEDKHKFCHTLTSEQAGIHGFKYIDPVLFQ